MPAVTGAPEKQISQGSPQSSKAGGKVLSSGNLVLAGVIAWFVINALVVSVSGEFPTNDDWIYCWCVNHLVSTGEFHLPATIAASIFPIFTGAAICKVFGFSYALLRCISLGFAFLGAAGLYLGLKEVGLQKREAAVGAGIFLANPLLINCSFGFMTDVPTLAMVNWFLFLLLRSLRQDKLSSWILCGGALCLAVASRQNTIVLVAAGLIAIIAQVINRRRVVAPILALVAVPCVLYVSLEPIMLKVADYPTAYLGYKALFTDQIKQFATLPGKSFPLLFQQIARMMCYFGLFCLPLVFSFVPAVLLGIRRHWKWTAACVATSAGLIGLPLAYLMSKHMYMPLSENLFRPPAVGAYCIYSGGLPMWSESNRLALTYVSGAAGVVVTALLLTACTWLVVVVTGKLKSGWRSTAFRQEQVVRLSGLAAVAVSTILFMGFLAVQTMIMNFDRYYLVALGPAILLIGFLWRFLKAERFTLVAVAALSVMAVYSTITAWDYMNFNRVRLEATKWLESQHVNPLEIDGGPEYNYFQNFALAGGYELSSKQKGWTRDWRGAPPRNEWRWWPITSENYMVCGTPLEGYKTLKTFKCFSSLKMRNREIFVLESLDKKPIQQDRL